MIKSKILEKISENYNEKIRLIYPDISKKKLQKTIDKIIEERFEPLNGHLLNNYDNTDEKMNTLQILDFIEEKKAITSGRGVLFMNHETMENPTEKVLESFADMRKFHKKEMFKYLKAGDNHLSRVEDKYQKNYKILMNSWFGVALQSSSYFFNVHAGLSIMGKGRSIISSLCFAFEMFMSNNIIFYNIEELIDYINKITKEEYTIDYNSILDEDKIITKNKLKKYLFKKCDGEFTEIYENIIDQILDNLSEEEINHIYYKNNLYKFMDNSKIQKLLKKIVDSKVPFTAAILEIPSNVTEEKEKKEYENLFSNINKLWDYLKEFVFYNYFIYNRIKKIDSLLRKTVIVIDTDSNFLNIDPFIKYLKKRGLIDSVYNDDIRYKMINTMACCITKVADAVCEKYSRNSNIPESRKKLLNMKNEFLYNRIVLVDRKKTYAGTLRLKEGTILDPSKLDIKGFLFKKSNFNAHIGDTLEDILYHYILESRKIDLPLIIKKIFNLENEIAESLKSGSIDYWKPGKIGEEGEYKAPMTLPVFRAVTTYNMLYPDKAMPFPAQVFTVKLLDDPDYSEMKVKYPREYGIIEKNILKNPAWNSYGMNVFALPRNATDAPEWLIPMIDVDSIVMDATRPFLSILQSIGFKTDHTLSDKEYSSSILIF